MYKLCKTEHSAQRQRDLEKGLLEAMLNKNYDDISISDLCDHLQIPRKSFYRYFSSKDGAFHALLDHTLQECNWFVEGCGSSQEAFEKCFQFWKEQKPLLDALQRSGLSGYLVQRTVSSAMCQNFSSHLLRSHPTINPQYATFFLISGVMSIMIQWHHSGCVESPEEMARTVSHLLTNPVFTV